jgi:transcriptional regulator with XRE-family HTH domain
MRESVLESDLFKDRLTLTREYRGWSQPELASLSGVSETSISHYENGSRMPSCDALVRLANCLEVTTDYLLGRADDMQLPQPRDPLFQGLARLSHADRALALGILKLLSETRLGKRKDEEG